MEEPGRVAFAWVGARRGVGDGMARAGIGIVDRLDCSIAKSA
jgi:hypothetical protein